MKILLTGFEPFGGEKINPSWEAVKQLHGQVIGGAEVTSLELPVSWERALPELTGVIERLLPDVIISVGQAGGRAKVTPEYVGINVMNGADNQQLTKTDERIISDAVDAHFATLPVPQMVAAMQQAAVPAAISYTAGTYLCNFLAYSVPHFLIQQNLPAKAGFIHIPYIPEQVVGKPAATPCLPLQTIVEGIRACVQVIATQGK